MAYFFGVNAGAGAAGNVVSQSSTTSRDIELVINTNANVPSKMDLVVAVEKLLIFIHSNGKVWS